MQEVASTDPSFSNNDEIFSDHQQWALREHARNGPDPEVRFRVYMLSRSDLDEAKHELLEVNTWLAQALGNTQYALYFTTIHYIIHTCITVTSDKSSSRRVGAYHPRFLLVGQVLACQGCSLEPRQAKACPTKNLPDEPPTSNSYITDTRMFDC